MNLLSYIEALNAKADLLMEQEPGLWMSKYTDDMSYWYDIGVFTVEDFKRNQLINGISDASKDLYGCRMRLEWDEMSIEDMEFQLIKKTLEHTQGNQKKAAEILGITDRTIRNKLKNMEI